MTNPNERVRLRAAPLDWPCDAEEFGAVDENFKPLSRDEAQTLIAQQPGMSLWRIVATQAAAGVVLVALWWLLADESSKALSALWGAVAVVAPNALAAWGMTRRTVPHVGAALFSLMLWESIKIVLVLAILVVAIKWVPDLSWLALLLTMIGCLKVYWLVLLARGRFK